MSTPQPPSPGARSGAASAAASGTASSTAPRALLAATWLVATVLAATIAWWAMTAVGGERRADGAGLVSQARVEQLLAAQGIDPTAPALGASPTPSATPTPEVGPAEPRPDGAASPVPVDPAGPGTEPLATAEVARTWDVTGGQVGAVCTGSTIALLYATPADGWTVEVERAGPAELEVELSRDDADARIRAECVGGTPEITRSEGSEDSGRDGGGGGDGGGDNGGDDNGGGDNGRDDSRGDGSGGDDSDDD